MSGDLVRMEKEECNETSAQGANRFVSRENRTGIPTQLKERMEQSTGMSFDDVRVHYNSSLPAKLDALAYTQGNQVEIGPGQERHLPHELGHVVQQKLGAVRANAMHSTGVAMNTDPELEHQADEIGAGKGVSGSVGEQSQVIQLFQESIYAEEGFSYPLKPEKPELSDSERPTMIFETMGTSLQDCKKIYEQSCQYDGNTICVFGLNKATTSKLNASNKEYAEIREEINQFKFDEKKRHEGGKLHLLYIFAFTWNALDKKDNSGYDMPFVEARLKVMDKAASIIESVSNTGERGNQYKFLYRWIDADAREDTSNNVPSDVLNALAKEDTSKILTGRYDWRHDEGNYPKGPKFAKLGKKQKEKWEKYYKEFLTKINEAEKDLRNFYHYLSIQRNNNFDETEEQVSARKVEDNDFAMKYGSYSDKIENNDFLPGYYLPETVFVMNQQAHSDIRDRLRGQMLGLPGKMKAQDKESMRSLSVLMTGASELTDIIMYDPRLSVQKPLKNEFSEGTYWGKGMSDFFKDEEQRNEGEVNKSIKEDEKKFIDALKNLRQSGFKQWYFKTDDTWDKWEDWRGDDKRKKIYQKGTDEYLQQCLNIKKCDLEIKLWEFLKSEETEETKGAKKSVLQIIKGGFR